MRLEKVEAQVKQAITTGISSLRAILSFFFRSFSTKSFGHGKLNQAEFNEPAQPMFPDASV